jgi:hypothetical protein
VENVKCSLEQFGEVERVVCPDDTKAKLYTTFKDTAAAVSAHAWIEQGGGRDDVWCGRTVVVRYAAIEEPPPPSRLLAPIYKTSEEAGVPGLMLIHDFVSVEEEKVSVLTFPTTQPSCFLFSRGGTLGRH